MPADGGLPPGGGGAGPSTDGEAAQLGRGGAGSKPVKQWRFLPSGQRLAGAQRAVVCAASAPPPPHAAPRPKLPATTAALVTAAAAAAACAPGAQRAPAADGSVDARASRARPAAARPVAPPVGEQLGLPPAVLRSLRLNGSSELQLALSLALVYPAHSRRLRARNSACMAGLVPGAPARPEALTLGTGEHLLSAPPGW